MERVQTLTNLPKKGMTCLGQGAVLFGAGVFMSVPLLVWHINGCFRGRESENREQTNTEREREGGVEETERGGERDF